jgi:histidinol dehydrogenase
VFGGPVAAAEAVARIVERVRAEGDAGLRALTLAFDGSAPSEFEVDPNEIRAAYDHVSQELVAALRLAADRIRAFHAKQLPRSWVDFEDGGTLGQIIRPLERVGIYSPKGSAGYPSTILMVAVPAKVAGVAEIVVAAPPLADGRVSPTTLVAADIAGVDRVFRIGGAQAIAALAYGTETIPRVDKILGPGNIFVTLAKRQVSGDVAIDQLAGPTETVVVADDSANPAWVAADLLAQAEHDPLASAVLIATSRRAAEAAAAEVARQAPLLKRSATIAESLARGGGAVVAGSLDAALALANEYAPEHLCLAISDPWAAVPKICNAGGVFVGEHSLEAVGDYTAGPSHVMPTGGTARFSSPVNVWDFLKITSLFALSTEQVAKIGPAAAAIADAEGFTAHAAAVRLRLAK